MDMVGRTPVSEKGRRPLRPLACRWIVIGMRLAFKLPSVAGVTERGRGGWRGVGAAFSPL